MSMGKHQGRQILPHSRNKSKTDKQKNNEHTHTHTHTSGLRVYKIKDQKHLADEKVCSH